MKLYYSPGACSLSPHIVMREAGIPVELSKVDLGSHRAEGDLDFSQINSKGYVPALDMGGGQVLTEGPVIIQYLGDQKPDSGLVPKAGTIERYRLQEWLNFITAEVHKSFGPLFDKNASADRKAAAHAAIERHLAWVDTQLNDRQYLMGDRFTVADAYLFTVVNWTRAVGIDLGRWPTLADYQRRVAERPKVREALQAEGLLH